MKSIWTLTAKCPEFDRPDGELRTDVLIIGGGITGILCAYMLQNAGVDCVIAEAGRIFDGISRNTTAKITVQHGLIYDKITKRYGAENALMYFEAQNRALQKYKEMCKSLDCDFRECDSYIYSCRSREKIEKEAEALSKINCSADFTETPNLPFETRGAVCVRNQAQFNPVRFISSVAKNLRIFENTRVIGLKPGEATTDGGRIKADKIIVATHFPFLNKHGGYFVKMYQHRSYVIALENAPLVKDMYADEDKRGLSFREYDGLLLLGGGGHRTGKKGGNWQELCNFAQKHYPNAREICRWATQDCMTLDSIPYIGLYSKSTPSLYVATGFNKWGMTSAMASAMILTDTIIGRENPYARVFSPDRSMLHPQLAVNMAESLLGILTPTAPRCPHLGCALKYNPCEHSWDCSCHGSRFTTDGKVINNPSNGNKKTN